MMMRCDSSHDFAVFDRFHVFGQNIFDRFDVLIFDRFDVFDEICRV